MAINLAETLLQKLSPDLMNAVARASGGDAATVEKTAKAAIPTILAGVVQMGSSEAGASRILDMLKAEGHDGSNLSEYAAKMGDPSSRGILLEQGTRIVSGLFGSKADGIMDALAGQTGGKKSMSASVLCLLGPYALGFLGKYVKDTGTDARGLSSLLGAQSSSLLGLLPGGLGKMLGLGAGAQAAVGGARAAAESQFARARQQATEAPVSRETREGPEIGRERGVVENGAAKSKRSWALPLGLGALALLAGLFAYKGRAPEIPKVAVPEVQAPAVGGGPEHTMPGVEAFEAYVVAPGKTGQIASFRIEGLTFPTASAELEPVAKGTVDRIAKDMHDHPKLHVRVEGHTDNQGDANTNRSLSEARAVSVKKALILRGVDPSKVDTAGYGPDRPVAPNETPDGRAKNRRIEILVLEH